MIAKLATLPPRLLILFSLKSNAIAIFQNAWMMPCDAIWTAIMPNRKLAQLFVSIPT